jgi:hypothetical protein
MCGLQVDGLAAAAAALGCTSQLASLSLAGSGISGTCLAAMADAGLAAAAALASLDISIPESKVGRSALRMQQTEPQPLHCDTCGDAVDRRLLLAAKLAPCNRHNRIQH